MATWEEMQEHFLEEDFVLRDSIRHEEQLSVIENAASEYLHKFYSKHYGINDRAKILDAPYFDVTKQLLQDIMHIFLEGVVTYEMNYLFKYLFHNRFFHIA